MRFALGVGLLAAVLLGLHALARTPPVIDFAWRQTRGTRYEPAVVRWALSAHGGRVERALARGDIRPGQTVDEVTAAYGPFRVVEMGRYRELQADREPGLWFEGYAMTARDGRLVSAGWASCTGRVVFFDTLTDADRDDLAREDSAYQQRRVERAAAPWVAAAGPAGVLLLLPVANHVLP